MDYTINLVQCRPLGIFPMHSVLCWLIYVVSNITIANLAWFCVESYFAKLIAVLH